MRVKKSLMLWVAVFALALPLLLTGTASAKYMGDGATPNGTTGGWNAPTDGICVLSIDVNGNMVTDPAITTARDCQARLVDVTAVTTGDTLANVCGTPAKNTDGVKYAAPGSSTCVTIDASGYITGSYSMVNKDRGAVMCQAMGGQLATATVSGLITVATKTVANGTAAKCIAYGWNYRGQDATGTPLTFGAKGVSPASSGTGFCYTAIRTGITTTVACPSSTSGTTVAATNAKLGYSMVGGNTCNYAYGTSGVTHAALTKIDGTAYAAAGDTVDLQALTQGECLANGASWANGWGFVTTGNTYGTADGWTSGTGVKFDVTKNVLNADEGCLHCHSYTSQQNGPAERFKDSALKTGHKNMLRKVTAGMKMAGPDGVMYDTLGYAVGTIDFDAATATVSGVAKPLLYLFGDWMAAAPAGLDVVVDIGGLAKYNGTSNYSCAACHSEGWSNPGPGTCSDLSPVSLGSPNQAACEAVNPCPKYPSGNTGAACVWTDPGLCSLSSKKSQSACTTAGGTWYPNIGAQGIGITDYAGLQPDQTSITYQGAGVWDNDGISCGRCHNAAQANTTSATIAASAYPATLPLATGMGSLAAGVLRNSTCFGCHQSMATTSNGTGADVDLTTPTALIVKNTTTIGYTPGFNGHVLGNSFLNSPHARFSGTVVPNSLGKYDLATNTAANYNSTFRGYSCYQGSVSASPAKTKADGSEIKAKADCDALYACSKAGYATQAACTAAGFAWNTTWRADTSNPASGANSIQGTCTTCHDVHQSLFVAGQEAIRKECEACHENADFAAAVPGTPQYDDATMAHPKTANTPWDSAQFGNDPCAVCHMPKPTAADFPMHVWRINSSASYTTFPTALEFGIGGAATRKIANTATDSKGYANAVWVDLDLACGQCHSATGLNYVAGNPLLTKVQLAAAADALHDGGPTTNTQCLTCHSSAQGTHRAVNPGVDHHNGTCTTCHAAGNGHFAPAMAAPNLNANTLKPAGSHNPLPYWSINSSLATACLSCHSTSKPKSGGGTVGAIVPSSTGDNHHNGHSSVPGTSFGGVSEANGSRGDNDPGMNCVGCHGKATIVSGPTSTGYVLKIAASGLSTSTVAAANGRVNTSGLCLGCHEVVQSGATQDHHAGTCTSCHSTNGSTANGTLAAGVAAIPGGVNCTVQCHNQQVRHPMTAAAIALFGASSGTVVCEKCHANSGVISGTTYTNIVGVKPTSIAVACGQCHGGGVLSTAPTFSVAPGAPWKSTAYLTAWAPNAHSVSPVANFVYSNSTTTGYTVNFNGTRSVCPIGSTCSYGWDFGDTGTSTSVAPSHTYLAAGPVTVTLTVTDNNGRIGSKSASITPLPLHTAPAVSTSTPLTIVSANTSTMRAGSYLAANNWTVSFTDTSTIMSNMTGTIVVNWGDRTIEQRAMTGSRDFTHTYTKASTYAIMHSVIDSGGGAIPAAKKTSTAVYRAVVPVKHSISGLVSNASGTGLAKAKVMLKLNGHTVKTAVTDASGNYTFSNALTLQAGASYTIEAYKYNGALKTLTHAPYYTFPTNSVTAAEFTGDLSGKNIQSTDN